MKTLSDLGSSAMVQETATDYVDALDGADPIYINHATITTGEFTLECQLFHCFTGGMPGEATATKKRVAYFTVPPQVAFEMMVHLRNSLLFRASRVAGDLFPVTDEERYVTAYRQFQEEAAELREEQEAEEPESEEAQCHNAA